MGTPEENSTIGKYGSKEMFEKKLEEGFLRTAFGTSEEIDGKKIQGMWIFYGPNGKVATYEHPKGITPDGHTIHVEPFEKNYSKKELETYIKKFNIKITKMMDLEQFIGAWKKQ